MGSEGWSWEGAKAERLSGESQPYLWYLIWLFNLTSNGPMHVLLQFCPRHTVHSYAVRLEQVGQ